ncbi:hypothetical protein HNS38_18200 [Lentimicrobium sp. L6]|uniref:hypothetical protein n=1 Tax=Lentimicrobium sp. L6 TaxID=2735916 RepID=UPI0015529847|nr:hypothetical protein [Lentimicrobium sp. L6]NPD86703.1 hypothetical protein [Lentimicrobium sp. L6]
MNDLPISFEQPLWLIIPILLVAIAIAALLYYRNSSFSKPLNYLLFFLRFCVILILALLLLNPYFFNETKDLQKPIIVVALDESESMLNGTDSTSLSESIQRNIDEIKQELSDTYELDFLSFHHQVNEQINFKFDGKRSDIGQVLKYTSEKYYMLPLTGIILLSDGQNNQGISPLHYAENQSTAIYPIIFGDTAKQKDVYIDAIFHNKVIRQNAKFPVDVVVQAEGFSGEKLTVRVEKAGRVLQQKEITLNSDNFNQEIRFELKATGSGLQSYSVRIPELENENNIKNNQSRFYIQSLESGNKILILGNNPHPDLGALASALRKVDGYEIDIKSLSDYPFSTSDYQLIVLHGLPSLDQRSKRIFEQADFKNKALWYIWSTSSDIPSVTKNDFPWESNQQVAGFEYSELAPKEDFSSFKMPQNWARIYKTYPPLYVPFVKWQSVSQNDVIFQQSIRGFESGEVLMGLWSKGQLKRAFLAGEGLWKWRIYDYQSTGSHEQFNSLIQRVSRYLLTGVYDDRFNIQYQSIYNETDLIEWEAQVYNKAFETINEGDVSLQIKNELGEEYDYLFSPQENGFSAPIGYLAAGSYSFKAKAQLPDTTLLEEGKFIVDAWNMEQARAGSNMELLKQMADLSGGSIYFPAQTSSLLEQLKNSPDAAQRYSITQEIINFIDLKWLALLLVLLLGTEWVLRKRFGSY